jgi:ribosomal protein S8
MSQLQNFLSNLNLCIKSNKTFFSCKKTEFILRIIKLLIKHNYFVGLKVLLLDKTRILVFLKLNSEYNRTFITSCRLVSTPNRPVYVKFNRWSSSQVSLLILSTSRGIMTHKEALAAQLGGLILFKII